METWISFLIAFVSIVASFKFFRHFRSCTKLPPGPTPLPLLGNILLLRKYSSTFFTLIHDLRAEYGPIFTLHFGSRPVVFIADHFLAHQALVQNGAAFADRPPAGTATRILYSNITIFTTSNGPNWTLLRRNLVSKILHPSRLRLHSDARKWSLQLLVTGLKCQSRGGAAVRFLDHFWPMMVDLSVFMCFGLKIEEKQINDIAHLLHRVLIYTTNSQNKLNTYPLKLGKLLFPKLWKELSTLRKEIESSLIPLMKARYDQRQHENGQKNKEGEEEERILPYLDMLMNLHLPEKNRKLEEGEIISLCVEFLNGVVHSIVVAMEWTMANIVKYPEIQEKLYAEIDEVMEPSKEHVTEDDLKKMPYLKAVILESLRRHPPGHFALPHLATEEVLLNGRYVVPEKTTVHFVVSEMAWDTKVWDEPMAFRPERFLASAEDDAEEVLTGKKEIKFMPFGGGRRICPGINLSMLHLQYFVANLVWLFEWSAVDEVDLEDKFEVSITMKTPLQARISARCSSILFL